MSTSRTREKADGELFKSTGIDDNATSTAVTIDASENVGIGTATTYGKATIEHAKGINNGLTLAVSDATANDNITGIQFSTNSVVSRPRAAIYSKSVTSQGVAGWGADLIFATRGAPDASTISESDERMRINSSGNVGIGTASPAQKLSLNSGYVQVGNGIGGAGGVKYPYSSSSADCRNWRTRSDITGYGDWGIEQSTTQSGETYATKFLITQTGIVTMPYQPAFNVDGSTNNAANAEDVIAQFNREKFDRGNNYNTSTYRFVAPVSGAYQFNANMRFDAFNGNYARLQFFVNGSHNSYDHGHSIIGNNKSTNYHTLNIAGVISLSANDYVDVRGGVNSGTSTMYMTEANFSGHLIG